MKGADGEPAGRPLDGLKALTVDVWYTLVYLPVPERVRLEKNRARAWTDPLVAAGLSRPRALRAFAGVVHWGRGEEARGRTPTLGDQVAWIGERTGVSLPVDPLRERLDRGLCSARVRVAPGARSTLERLAEEGVRLGVVSNVLFESGEAARSVLASTRFLDRMSAVVLSCEQRWAKPRPEPFQQCLRALRVPPAAAAHIGDLGYDVLGARRAGLAAVWYTGLHGFESPRPAPPPRDHNVLRLRRWPDLLSHAVPRRVDHPPHSHGRPGPVRRSFPGRPMTDVRPEGLVR